VQNAGQLMVVVQNKTGAVPLPFSQAADLKTFFLKKRLA
jgi:hypothetical protein